jgi:imidazolonepropionase-like amidohydrolase
LTISLASQPAVAPTIESRPQLVQSQQIDHGFEEGDLHMRIIGFVSLLLFSTSLVAQSAETVYIHAGRLLDQPGQMPRGPSTIIVRDGKIVEVRDGLLAPKSGATLVDLKDQFVLPGLIDMHVHIAVDDNLLRGRLEGPARDAEDVFVIAQGNARRTLEAGFTTIRDLGGDGRTTTTLRDAINAGAIVGPTIIPAGMMISVTGGPWWRERPQPNFYSCGQCRTKQCL